MAKRKSKSLNDPARVLRTYAELAPYARAFAGGHLQLLILLGPPGVGKSRVLREAVGDSAYWIDGSVSAFGIYIAAYEHRSQAIVLDDPDGLYRDRNGIRLLKALCQSEPVKSLGWHSDAKTLERRGIPHQFSTTSQVAIVANQWESLNLDVAALEDRGHVIRFEPSPLEVHMHAAGWFWDQEIFDFAAEHLHLTSEHSLRTYVLAGQLKEAGIDWRAYVLSRCLSGTALVVAELKADPKYAQEEDRAAAFTAAGHGCRATYFNHAKKLAPLQPPPKLTLVHTQPPALAQPATNLMEMLRQRFGRLGSG